MTHPNPNNPSPEMIEAPVDRKLILAIDSIRTTLQEHDGNRPDCVYCRIFDHINAAYGEAVGEPIAAMQAQQPNPSPADELTTLQARLDAVAEWAKRTDAELRDDADKADTNYDLNIAVGGSDVLAELFAILAKDGEV